MLFKKQFPVEEKTQVAPNGLRAKRGGPGVGGVSKVYPKRLPE
jgi:hypothetical protein